MAIPRPSDDYITPITVSFSLEPTSTVLVLIDLQYASACRTEGLGKRMIEQGTEHITEWRFDRIEQVLLPNVKRLLAFFREHGLRILYVTLGSMMADYSDAPEHMKNLFKTTNNHAGTREHEILDELKPLPGEYVLNKTTIGAFNSTGIDNLLRMWGAKYLLFTGVSTNMCVDGTARDAVDRGYRCILVEDALGGPKEEYHRAAIINWQRLYGRANITEEVIKELEQGL